MESTTKNKQTQEEIVKMVQKAFGQHLAAEDIKIRELTEGCFNVAYEIGLPDKEVILKIAPEISAKIMSYEKNIMQAEVEGLRMVKEKTHVPVPEVYYYDTSRSICNAQFFFMEKLYGASFFQLQNNDMTQKEQEPVFYEIGKYNQEINQITGTQYGYIGQPKKQSSSWKETFMTMISDLLTDGEMIEIDLGVEYSEVNCLIQKASFALEEVKQPVLVHWDLWEGNVFVKDGKITGIIDFERALWGDPLMEVFFRHHAYHPEFIKGYGTDLRSIAPVRALLYDIYLYLIMVIETKYRNYQEDWQYKFATKELQLAVAELNKQLKL